MKLKALSKKYLEKDFIYETEYKRLESKIKIRKQQIERLEKKKSQVEAPYWIDFLVEPIAKELVKLLPGYHYEILGPFGICCETSIHFYKDGVPDKEKFEEPDNCKSICFVPLDLTTERNLGIRDEKIDTEEYQKGTQGEMNGMNHPTIELSPDMEIKDLFQYVK